MYVIDHQSNIYMQASLFDSSDQYPSSIYFIIPFELYIKKSDPYSISMMIHENKVTDNSIREIVN